MKTEYQDFFLNELLRIWDENHAMRPSIGIWIAEIEIIKLENEPDKEIVHNAWFLKDGNIEKRNEDEYVRFIVVQGNKPWNSAMYGTHNPIFKKDRPEIGISTFGIDPITNDYFFSWQFGGLFGRTEIYKCSKEGVLTHSYTSELS